MQKLLNWLINTNQLLTDKGINNAKNSNASNGRRISQVPDDVTDEEVIARFATPDPEPEEQPVVEVAEPEPEEDKSFFESAKDVAFDFRKVLARTEASLLSTGIDAISGLIPGEEGRAMRDISGQIGAAVAARGDEELLDPETGRIAATETLPGKFAEIAPYIVVGSRVQGARAIQQTPRLVQGLLSGVVTDQLLADEDENIFNIIEDALPETAIADYASYMSAKKDDDPEVKKAKASRGRAWAWLVNGSSRSAAKLAAKSRNIFNKSYTELTPKEQGEIFESHLKESRNRTELSRREQQVDFQETAEGAAQVRQQQSNKLNRFFRQLFTTRGFFTNNAQSAFDNAEYAQRAAVSRAEHIATRLSQSMDEMMKSSDRNIADEVQEALTSDRLGNLLQRDRATVLLDIQEEFGFSSEVADEVLNARQLIDTLSKEVTGSSHLSDSIKEIVNENVGSYMRRSYRLFEDTGYKPSEDVVNDAKDYLANINMRNDPDLSEAVAYQNAEQTIKQILDAGGVSDRTAAGDYFAKVQRANKEILKGKGRNSS